MEINIEEMADKFIPMIMEYGIQVISALVIFIVGKWLAGKASNFIKGQMEKHNIDPMINSFASNLIRWGLIAFVAIAALGQIGIQTASFIAIIGAAGLAVGLALQGSLANFAAGILILIFKPFKLGDFISAGDESGTVSEIRIFSVQLVTPDNKEITLPNNAIMSSSITNFSAKDKRRVDLTIGVSYDAFLPGVRKILEAIVAAEPLILHNEANLVAVSELGDSSVNLVVRSWVKTSDYWPVYFKLTETIKLKLDEANIGIPYPQMDVHVQKPVS
jgi:small conductance mechanosensitive channel